MMARLKHPGRVGTEAERRVRDDLQAAGYYFIRAAGSKGVADLVAVGVEEVLFVQVKRTENGHGVGSVIPPLDRRKLVLLADRLTVGHAIVAIVRPRKPIEYYDLTGFGPKDFVTHELEEIDISHYTVYESIDGETIAGHREQVI
jgi:Holliday junction resolvase